MACETYSFRTEKYRREKDNIIVIMTLHLAFLGEFSKVFASHAKRGRKMDDKAVSPATDFVALTGDVVSAYVSNNSIRPADLADLIGTVHRTLLALSTPPVQVEEKREKATPAQIRKSITPDALISFEDGKPYKTLRRHLTIRGLSPESYRAKHGLPVDYPMTAASYSAQRSALAQTLGLGRHRQETKAASPADDVVPIKTAVRGRPRKRPATAAAE